MRGRRRAGRALGARARARGVRWALGKAGGAAGGGGRRRRARRGTARLGSRLDDCPAPSGRSPPNRLRSAPRRGLRFTLLTSRRLGGRGAAGRRLRFSKLCRSPTTLEPADRLRGSKFPGPFLHGGRFFWDLSAVCTQWVRDLSYTSSSSSYAPMAAVAERVSARKLLLPTLLDSEAPPVTPRDAGAVRTAQPSIGDSSAAVSPPPPAARMLLGAMRRLAGGACAVCASSSALPSSCGSRANPSGSSWAPLRLSLAPRSSPSMFSKITWSTASVIMKPPPTLVQ